MNPRSRTSILVAWLVAALGLGAGIGAIAYATLSDDSSTVVRQVTVSSSEPAATGKALAIGDIYERSQKAVVELTASATQFSGSQSQGSGFVFDDDGHVITNQHVVEGASSISVRFWDGSTRPATLVGTDPSTDLAVIKVEAPASFLEPLRLGDSSAVDVGDTVVAMGSPFGLEGTVTSGIVSALHRQMTAPNNFKILDSIQTDAAINHGNSGGPLLDQEGRVVGVNAQIESESGGSDGVGFAIPSNTVRSIASQLIQTGEAEHAYLGVSMVTVSEGAAITQIQPDTPAERAGLEAATDVRVVDGQEVPSGGDIVVELDGEEISTSAELQSEVDAKQPGDTVSITVLRNGDRRTFQVKLGTRPERIP